jgi:hypothetical protein
MEGVLSDVLTMERELGRFGLCLSLSDVVWEQQVESDGRAITNDMFFRHFLRQDNTVPRCIQQVYHWLTTLDSNVIRITSCGTRLEYRLRLLQSEVPNRENILSIERDLRRYGFKLLNKSDVTQPHVWKVWSIPNMK